MIGNNIFLREALIDADYNHEIIEDLILKSQRINIPYYFNSVQQGNINPLHRSKVVEWIIEVCDDLELHHITKHTAILIVDLILAKMEVSKKNLQLLAVTSVMTIIKHEENFRFQISDAINLCARAYSSMDIINMELLILKLLNWKVMYPSPGQIARVLLIYSQVIIDIEINLVFRQIDNFIDILLHDFMTAAYGPLILGIVSALFALERSNMKDQSCLFLKYITCVHEIQLVSISSCYDYLSAKIASIFNANPNFFADLYSQIDDLPFVSLNISEVNYKKDIDDFCGLSSIVPSKKDSIDFIPNEEFGDNNNSNQDNLGEEKECQINAKKPSNINALEDQNEKLMNDNDQNVGIIKNIEENKKNEDEGEDDDDYNKENEMSN